MPRTGENIYKRKDGRWEGRYIKGRINGKTQYGAVYAKSYHDVKIKLDEAKSKLKENTGKWKKPVAKAGKVADIGKQWLSEMAVTLKESSVIKYEDLLRRYIYPEFGESELSEISNQQLIDFVNSLLSGGGVQKQGLAPATVAEILSAINSIRVYALRRDYAVPFSPECISLKREQKEIRVFSLEEEKQLVDYLQEHMDLSALGILVCLFTGIRVGELCAMKWDDINLPEKKMNVRKTMQRLRVNTLAEGSAAAGKGSADKNRTKVKILEPKSACSIRTIPLPDAIMEILADSYIPGTYLLTGNSSRYVEPRTMQNRFKKILSACGIPDANFHATRHTFATRCIELGFDIKSLSEILGHANVAITMNRYVHPTMALKAENMNRFSSLFTVK